MNGPLLLLTNGLMRALPAEVRHDKPDFCGRPGWARFARKVLLTETDANPASDAGPLLFAEWVAEDGCTVRLGPHPQEPGAHQIIAFAPHDAAFVCDPVAVAGRGALKGRTLLYDIYWADDGDGAVRPALEVFRGFGDAA